MKKITLFILTVLFSGATLVAQDSDLDGLDDDQEDVNGNNIVDPGETDPNDADSDDDNLSDGVEVLETLTDPLSADSDNDNLSDAFEVENANVGYDPLDADVDDDGLTDGQETNNGNSVSLNSSFDSPSVLSPFDSDSDDDGRSDGDEVNGGDVDVISDPTLADSDGDGLNDGDEVTLGTIPFGVGESVTDFDGDGLTDGREANSALPNFTGTDPRDADSDDDTISDGDEVNGDPATNPNEADTDNDGLDDNDEDETEPNNDDRDGDGLLDGEELTGSVWNKETKSFIAFLRPEGLMNESMLDPDNSDSDGDNCSDGDEISLGNDPTDATSGGPQIFYQDVDGDGFGDINSTTTECVQPAGFVTNSSDCDDTDTALNPQTIWYRDSDQDGFGDPNNSLASCTQPTGYISDNTDCDDTDPNVFPGAPALADGKNNDCSADGSIDKVSQTISFSAISDVVFSDAIISLSATSTSGLLVGYSVVSGPATINGTTLTLTGAGPVTVLAAQAGNETEYLAAESVTQTFCVNPTITQTGNTLTTNSESGNMWFFNGQMITGETGLSVDISTSGVYSVQNGGCSSTNFDAVVEEPAPVTTGIIEELESSLSVYPNPAANHIVFNVGISFGEQIEIELSDFSGKRYMKEMIETGNNSEAYFDISQLKTGVYLYTITIGSEFISGKFLKY